MQDGQLSDRPLTDLIPACGIPGQGSSNLLTCATTKPGFCNRETL